MSYQDPYQPQYGQQPPQPGQPPVDQPYSGGPSYPVTPGPTDYSGYPVPQSGPPGYGPPQSAPPGYGAPQPAYGQPMYAQPVVAVVATPTNTMAIMSLVFAFVFTPLGIVFGHMARSQIKRTGEQGDGLALAGLIISYIALGSGLACLCVFVILPIIGIGILGASTSTSGYNYLHMLTAMLGLG